VSGCCKEKKAMKPCSPTASRYIEEHEARLGKIPIAPAPPISKMLAADLRCHKSTLERWICMHKSDDIPSVMDAWQAAVDAIEHLL
jgi:hypothetical protein